MSELETGDWPGLEVPDDRCAGCGEAWDDCDCGEPPPWESQGDQTGVVAKAVMTYPYAWTLPMWWLSDPTRGDLTPISSKPGGAPGSPGSPLFPYLLGALLGALLWAIIGGIAWLIFT